MRMGPQHHEAHPRLTDMEAQALASQHLDELGVTLMEARTAGLERRGEFFVVGHSYAHLADEEAVVELIGGRVFPLEDPR